MSFLATAFCATSGKMRRSEEEKSAFLEGGPQADELYTPCRRYQAYPIISAVLVIVAVVSGFIGFYTGQLFPGNKACAQVYTSWCKLSRSYSFTACLFDITAPARGAMRYEARQVEGAFFAPSKFRGQPSAEIDAAWDDIWQSKNQSPSTIYNRLTSDRNSWRHSHQSQRLGPCPLGQVPGP